MSPLVLVAPNHGRSSSGCPLQAAAAAAKNAHCPFSNPSPSERFLDYAPEDEDEDEDDELLRHELLELELDEDDEDHVTESSSCSRISRISGAVAGFSRTFLRQAARSVKPRSLLAIEGSSYTLGMLTRVLFSVHAHTVTIFKLQRQG